MRGRRGRMRGCSRKAVRFLEPTLLLLLHHGSAHGYELLEQLGEFGLESLNQSGVYRLLRDMEEMGWVTSNWDEEQTQGPPRRVYEITTAGDDTLSLWTADLRETRSLIDHILAKYSQHMKEGEGAHH
jgi:PadR family transcriptional regulator PadR